MSEKASTAESAEKTDTTINELLLDDELAPPTANGEVVFDAPWQGRVFGMARLLAEEGHYSWDEFRAHLIEKIGDWDRSATAQDPRQDYRYYDHFLAAFQALLAEKGLLDEALVDARHQAFTQRPHGHDH
jgi:nitrile hydratase accessory protein